MLPKLAPEMSSVLSPMQKGRMWRVQIEQPNGSVRYFGRFASEKRAREWIVAHAWLMVSDNGGAAQCYVDARGGSKRR